MCSKSFLMTASLTKLQLRASQGPLTPSQQPAHLRRESSQSAHSNMSGVDMANRPFVPPNGRGRGYMQPYGGPHSPAMNYRQPSNQRGPPNMPGQFQNQPGMNNSPYGRGRGSPAMMHVQPHMPQGMPPGQHGMPYGAYPQHLGPQQYVCHSTYCTNSSELTRYSNKCTWEV